MSEATLSEARLVESPALHAAALWSELPPERLNEVQEERSEVRRLAEAAGLPLTGPTLTIWRMISPERIRAAPAVLVAAPFAAVGRLESVALPAGSAAHLRLEGPFWHLSQAWEHLFLACHAKGWRPSGLNWEIYENDDTSAPPAADLYAQLG